MPDTLLEERARLIREVRQRLEALGRAGIDRIPTPSVRAAPRHAPNPPAEAPAPVAAAVVEVPRRAATDRSPGAVPVSVASVLPKILPPALLFGHAEPDAPIVPPEERPARLAALAAEVAGCVRCPHLAASRTRTVFGSGSPTARLLFVGEAPGADEDRTGLPFVGRAGELLTTMITNGMGLTRDEVYIANVLKCRPPENRSPEPDEVKNCLNYLEAQIAVVRPQFLCLLGATAAKALLETSLSLGRLRGKWHRYRDIPTIVTYHPSYLLRTPSAKKDAWDDLQMLMQSMGIKPPNRKK